MRVAVCYFFIFRFRFRLFCPVFLQPAAKHRSWGRTRLARECCVYRVGCVYRISCILRILYVVYVAIKCKGICTSLPDVGSYSATLGKRSGPCLGLGRQARCSFPAYFLRCIYLVFIVSISERTTRPTDTTVRRDETTATATFHRREGAMWSAAPPSFPCILPSSSPHFVL